MLRLNEIKGFVELWRVMSYSASSSPPWSPWTTKTGCLQRFFGFCICKIYWFTKLLLKLQAETQYSIVKAPHRYWLWCLSSFIFTYTKTTAHSSTPLRWFLFFWFCASGKYILLCWKIFFGKQKKIQSVKIRSCCSGSTGKAKAIPIEKISAKAGDLSWKSCSWITQ